MTEVRQKMIDKKRVFFTNLALRVEKSLRLHKIAGLWEETNNEREWANVTDHCLAETARVEVFADILKFPPNIKKDLMLAAAVHDFFKKTEKTIVSLAEPTWESFEKTCLMADMMMRAAELPERVITIANSVGHNSLIDIETLVLKKNLTDEETARLILHYVDDYTIDSTWAVPCEITATGKRINDLDRRLEKNNANPRYARLNEDGREYFRGETTFEVQRRIGTVVQERITVLVNERVEHSLSPYELPFFIDTTIRAKIANNKF